MATPQNSDSTLILKLALILAVLLASLAGTDTSSLASLVFQIAEVSFRQVRREYLLVTNKIDQVLAPGCISIWHRIDDREQRLFQARQEMEQSRS